MNLHTATGRLNSLEAFNRLIEVDSVELGTYEEFDASQARTLRRNPGT